MADKFTLRREHRRMENGVVVTYPPGTPIELNAIEQQRLRHLVATKIMPEISVAAARVPKGSVMRNVVADGNGNSSE
jgi:hypothetical protein